MKNSIYVFAIITLLFTACKNDKKQVESNQIHSKEMQMTSDDGHEHDLSATGESIMKEDGYVEGVTQKNKSTTAIIDGYLLIKNALVEGDKDGAAAGGKTLLLAFAKFDMSNLTESQHTEYMEIYENAKEQAEHIVKNPIDHQREHFEVLSTDINDLITLLGTDKTLYQDYCPMVNGGKGAIWLSEIKDIKNPYLGTEMPTCGKIQKKIN